MLLCSCLSSLAFTPVPDVSPERIRAALPAVLGHPYLYFSEKDKPLIKKRIKTDLHCAELFTEMIEKADSYLQDDDERKADLEVLAFVYQMTDDQRYAQKAFSILSQRNYSKGSPELFDLNSSRVCRALALLYDWLYTGLDDGRRAYIRDALLNQLSRIRNRYDKTWWVYATRCNWNPVCNSAAGVAAIALLADDPALTDVMAEAYNGIYRTYNEIGQDGGWCEGVNYWSYGLFTSLYYADALDQLTGGQFNLLAHPKIVANPVSFGVHTLVPCGSFVPNPHDEDWKSVDFEDSGDSREDASYKYSRIAAATGSGEAVWLKRTIFPDGGSSVFDILWPEPEITPAVPAAASKHFQETGWVVMRDGFNDPESVMLTAVCAEHRDPTREMYLSRFPGADLVPVSEQPWGINVDTYFMSHGHLHAGTFNLYWQGEAYISEIGKIGYPNDYWTVKRWDYPFANCLGHNVVMVDGEQQISGKGIGGTVQEFRSGADRDYLLMDATKAYLGEKLKSWRRHVVLDKPDVALVLDEISADTGSVINVRFHSDCLVEQHDGFLLLKGKAGMMALIPVGPEHWTFSSGEHDLDAATQAMKGKRFHSPGNAVFYTDIEWVSSSRDSLVATLVLPVCDVEEAAGVATSVQLNRITNTQTDVIFKRQGELSRFCFKVTGQGFCLEP